MDSLARKSVRSTQAYVNYRVCLPEHYPKPKSTDFGVPVAVLLPLP
jgi:hypothetical protein